jgi:hypothetical protein
MDTIMSDNWISVEDEMPEEEGVYLCHWDDGVIETYDCEIDGNYWDVPVSIFKSVANSKGGISRVTHWQPLPSPPQLRNE